MIVTSYLGWILLLVSGLCLNVSLACNWGGGGQPSRPPSKAVSNLRLNNVNPVTEGTRVSLTCECETFPPASIRWYKEGDEQRELKGEDTFIQDSLTSQSVLSIIFHKSDHKARYFCCAANSDFPDKQCVSTTMNVRFSPYITLSKSISTKQGISSRIECLVEANPAPTSIHITKGSTIMSEKFVHVRDQLYQSVAKFDLTESYWGTVSCIAINGLKLASQDIVVEGCPRVSLTPQVEVNVGDSHSIVCNVTGLPAVHELKWFKEGDPTVLVNGPFLNLTNITLPTGGHYYCEAYSKYEQLELKSNASFDLKVLHRPGQMRVSPLKPGQVQIKPLESRPIGALVGDNVSMIATSDPPGWPEPTYKWWVVKNFKDHIVSTDEEMNLINLQEDEAGLYKCEAENKVGRTYVPYSFTVEVLKPVLDGPLPLVKTSINATDFELTCTVQGRPVEPIVWSKDGEVIVPGDYYEIKRETLLDVDDQVVRLTEKLQFRGAKRPGHSEVFSDDIGTYICSLKNHVEQIDWTTALEIDGMYPPEVLVDSSKEATLGDTLSIVCNVSAHPAPYKIQWIKEGDGEFIVDGPKLDLDITLSSGGRYICEAYNVINKKRHNSSAPMDLTVVYGPGKPNISPSNSLVLVGENVTFTCTADPTGLPLPEYTWTKVSTGDVLSHQAQLDMTSIEQSDAGLYKCEASNKIGRSETTMRLDVVEPNFVLLPSTETITVGDVNFKLSCSAQGRKVHPVVWLKDDIEIVPGEFYAIKTDQTDDPFVTLNSVLYFTGTNRNNQSEIVAEDAGNYTCILDNDIEVVYSTVEVLVQDNPPSAQAIEPPKSNMITFVILGSILGLAFAGALVAYIIRRKRAPKFTDSFNLLEEDSARGDRHLSGGR